jgi:hypothetical protein
LVKSCSDLWAIHQRKCKEWQKGGFSSRSASNEITTRGYMVLTSAECTTIMTAVLMVTSGLGSSFDWMVWLGIDGFGLVFVELCDHFVPLCAFVIILCDIL